MQECHLPAAWSFLDAAAAYSAFAGILGGFVFLGAITLMTARADFHDDSESQRSYWQQVRRSRERALMLFLPALLSLLVASFLFGEISGEQVCTRGYMEGMIAASLLALGSIGVFGGIRCMLEVYVESGDLRFTASVFTFIAFFIVTALLVVSGVDVMEGAFRNDAPWYTIWMVVIFGTLVLASVIAIRIWFMPRSAQGGEGSLQISDSSPNASASSFKISENRAAVYFPAAYVCVVVALYGFLTSFSPNDWPKRTLNDWKEYLALSVTLFFPGINLIIYARAIPGQNKWDAIEHRLAIVRKWFGHLFRLRQDESSQVGIGAEPASTGSSPPAEAEPM